MSNHSIEIPEAVSRIINDIIKNKNLTSDDKIKNIKKFLDDSSSKPLPKPLPKPLSKPHPKPLHKQLKTVKVEHTSIEFVKTLLEKYQELILNFWFPNKLFNSFWFKDIMDQKIKDKFGNFLQTISSCDAKTLINVIESSDDEMNCMMSIVITLDQFTRNIYRHNDFKRNDYLCIELVKYFYNKKTHLQLPINKRIFFLLPFRHQRSTPLFKLVLEEIKNMKECCTLKTDMEIINKFERATYMNYYKNTDAIEHYNNDSKKYDYKHVNHNITPSIVNEYKGIPMFNKEIESTKIFRELTSYVRNNKLKRLCISLSGGVDSMVICHILKHMLDRKIIEHVCAVHIDYGNRKVSKQEADMVKHFCMFLNIPLLSRRIDCIRRCNKNLKSIYEEATKLIRFGAYKYAIELYGSECVLLGHHRGDLVENTLMSFIRGKGILELDTMKEYNIIDSVPIGRPLLNIDKLIIFQYAHIYLVPYLNDTTLNCLRGVVRKQIIPSLKQKIPSLEKNILYMGNQSTMYKTTVHKLLIEPVINSVINNKYGFTLKTCYRYKHFPLILWSNILSSIFHNKGVRMISNKNVNTFKGWFDSNKKNLFTLSNGYICLYDDDTKNIIFMKKYIFSTYDKGTRICKTSELINNKIIYNRWCISISDCKISDCKISNELSYSKLLNGGFMFPYNTCKHSSCTVSCDYKDKSQDTRNSSTRTILKKVPKMSKYLPKIYFCPPCDVCISNDLIISLLIYYSIL